MGLGFYDLLERLGEVALYEMAAVSVFKAGVCLITPGWGQDVGLCPFVNTYEEILD